LELKSFSQLAPELDRRLIVTKRRNTKIVLTPYVDELNQAIKAGLEPRGLTVVHIAGLGTITSGSAA
jgi:maleate cis-trans isomerase